MTSWTKCNAVGRYAVAIAFMATGVGHAAESTSVQLYYDVLKYATPAQVKARFPAVTEWSDRSYKRYPQLSSSTFVIYPSAGGTNYFKAGNSDIWLLPTFYFLQYKDQTPRLSFVEIVAKSSVHARDVLDATLLQRLTADLGKGKTFELNGSDGEGTVAAHVFREPSKGRLACLVLPVNKQKDLALFYSDISTELKDACSRP